MLKMGLWRVDQTRSQRGMSVSVARELVAYFERRRPGGVQTLAEYVRGKRPQAFG